MHTSKYNPQVPRMISPLTLDAVRAKALRELLLFNGSIYNPTLPDMQRMTMIARRFTRVIEAFSAPVSYSTARAKCDALLELAATALTWVEVIDETRDDSPTNSN